MKTSTLAMAFKKEKAESECTEALSQIAKQLGKLLSIPTSNTALNKEWVDEMKNKWVRNLSEYGAHVKTDEGRLSKGVFLSIIVEAGNSPALAASSSFASTTYPMASTPYSS